MAAFLSDIAGSLLEACSSVRADEVKSTEPTTVPEPLATATAIAASSRSSSASEMDAAAARM
jgi:hypothetical protein